MSLLVSSAVNSLQLAISALHLLGLHTPVMASSRPAESSARGMGKAQQHQCYQQKMPLLSKLHPTRTPLQPNYQTMQPDLAISYSYY